MFDNFGRPYAKVSEVKKGSVLELDDAFTCAKKGSHVTVDKDKEGLFFPCKEGKHYLEGQLNDFFDEKESATHYVGCYLIRS